MHKNSIIAHTNQGDGGKRADFIYSLFARDHSRPTCQTRRKLMMLPYVKQQNIKCTVLLPIHLDIDITLSL